jgi:hypothetical protein
MARRLWVILSKMRLKALLAAAMVIAVAIIVAVGPAVLRPWSCHHTPERPTSRGALNAYYASCWFGPNTVEGPSDAGKESTAYSSWYAVDEFTVVYRGGKTRFMLVGRKTPSSGWRALPPEGTGP